MISAQQRATDGGTLLLEETFAFDALGNRIQQQTWTSATGWVTTNFAYDGPNVFADLDGSDALQTRYVRPNGVDALGARIVGGVVSWFNTDRQGSLRLITSGTGSVLDAIDYDAFGKKISEKRSGGGFAVRLHGSGRGQQPGPAIQPGALVRPGDGHLDDARPGGLQRGRQQPQPLPVQQPQRGHRSPWRERMGRSRRWYCGLVADGIRHGIASGTEIQSWRKLMALKQVVSSVDKALITQMGIHQKESPTRSALCGQSVRAGAAARALRDSIQSLSDDAINLLRLSGQNQGGVDEKELAKAEYSRRVGLANIHSREALLRKALSRHAAAQANAEASLAEERSGSCP